MSGAGEGDENLVALLSKFGRYVGSDDFTNFRLHTYTDIELDRAWKFYAYLEPVTIHYDGGIDLQGLALGQGEEQRSSQQPLELGQDHSLWVALQWQATPGLETDYAISLRLYNSEGEKSYQEDYVLGNSTLRVRATGRRTNRSTPCSTLISGLISGRVSTSCG